MRDFVPAHDREQRHPDAQGALLRSLSRRDLLLISGSKMKRKIRPYTAIGLGPPAGMIRLGSVNV